MAIPLLSTPDRPISATTQDLIPIVDIVDGVIIYKSGGGALIMESTSLNFDLLSEKEQEAVIASYAGLLNSFNFPVQIVVRSQKKDISIYLNFLTEAKGRIKNEKLLHIMTDYEKFITDAIKKKNVLSKKFYIVLPFSQFELGLGKSAISSLNIRKTATLPYTKSYVVRKAKISLYPKRDHLIRQANRLNIKLMPLSTIQVIDLFYNIYNPEPPVKETKNY